MGNKDFRWINVIKFAGAFCACAIGSGFATGQEIMQFFSAQGLMSIGTALITTILFSWFGATIMQHGKQLQLKVSSSIIKYYFGDKLGMVFEWFVQIFLFMVFVIMISGAGATLSEYYGINPYIGRVLMAALAFITVILGLKKLTDILGMLGPIIIVFAVGVGLVSALQNIEGLKNINETMSNLNVMKGASNWVLSGLLYPGYNVVACIIFLCGIGSSAMSRKEAVLGGVTGGIMFGAAALCMNLGILANITQVHDKQVPSLALATNIAPILGVIFSVILIAGIYTTAVPMLWGVCNKFAEEKTKKFNILAICLTVVAFCLGLLPFSELVNIVYPYSGYFGIFLLCFIFYHFFRPGNTDQIGADLNKISDLQNK